MVADYNNNNRGNYSCANPIRGTTSIEKNKTTKTNKHTNEKHEKKSKEKKQTNDEQKPRAKTKDGSGRKGVKILSRHN